MESRKGFTLVELSLAIAFIGVLSITIALIISNTISTYRRGITMSQINTVGMDIVDDMRGAVQGSPTETAEELCQSYRDGGGDYDDCMNDGGRLLTTITVNGDVNQSVGEVPVYGAFCTGKYSYIWNSGYFFNGDYEVDGGLTVGATLSYKEGDETKTKEDFKLLKIEDDTRAVCRSYSLSGDFSIDTVLDSSSMTDVLGDELANNNTGEKEYDNNMAIYGLETDSPAVDEKSHNSLYTVSIILGTVQGGINIASSGNFCAAPEDDETASIENFDYCSINKFNFAAQANGGKT